MSHFKFRTCPFDFPSLKPWCLSLILMSQGSPLRWDFLVDWLHLKSWETITYRALIANSLLLRTEVRLEQNQELKTESRSPRGWQEQDTRATAVLCKGVYQMAAGIESRARTQLRDLQNGWSSLQWAPNKTPHQDVTIYWTIYTHPSPWTDTPIQSWLCSRMGGQRPSVQIDSESQTNRMRLAGIQSQQQLVRMPHWCQKGLVYWKLHYRAWAVISSDAFSLFSLCGFPANITRVSAKKGPCNPLQEGIIKKK